MNRGSVRFHEILKELGDLHDKKQKDYGLKDDPFWNVRASERFGIAAWIGCMIRANDKMVRIQKAARGCEMANERIEDSFRDLAVYAIIGLCLFEEQRTDLTGTDKVDITGKVTPETVLLRG